MDNKNLRAIDSRQKSVLGTGDIKITASVWSAISFWNASRVLTKKGRALGAQDDLLVYEMETNTSSLCRNNNRDTWIKLLLNAVIKKEGSLDFMDGESLNWPKIKQPNFVHGITVLRITRIIMGHRDALKHWSQQQSNLKTAQKKLTISHPVTLLSVESAAAAEAEEEAKYTDASHSLPQETSDLLPTHDVPESWEDL
jgi:hypothetical protein